MTAQETNRLRFTDSEYLMTVLRVAVGTIFLIGGYKLAFPPDPQALAASYVDPATGWISPVFAEAITGQLGLQISTFLRIQGVIEIALGLLMIAGLFTPVVAVLMGLMFWSFTVANPVAGQIRLSRDIALMGFCFAIVVGGAGAASVDERMRGVRGKLAERRDSVLVIVRLSTAYALIASALFSSGVFANHLNSTLPVEIVLLLGVAFAAGLFPRWTMGIVFLWLLYVVVINLGGKGVFPGLDSIKREIGFLAASLVYLLAGPDQWSFPRVRHRGS
jgi:uncharacterized membrane protein YphA (DoxX/SURF4 family)